MKGWRTQDDEFRMYFFLVIYVRIRSGVHMGQECRFCLMEAWAEATLVHIASVVQGLRLWMD
ncbi:hypothetical protein SOVF_032890 isoform B [Spinacia oleracea]|nr:hypothetical protein SOVF_032890 isoform B [Spinacia oleracea]